MLDRVKLPYFYNLIAAPLDSVKLWKNFPVSTLDNAPQNIPDNDRLPSVHTGNGRRFRIDFAS